MEKSKALRKDNPRRGLQYATNVRLHVHRTACSAYWSVTEAQAVESAIISLFLPDDFDKADSALKNEACLFEMSHFFSKVEALAMSTARKR